jgi:hypothetical protein
VCNVVDFGLVWCDVYMAAPQTVEQAAVVKATRPRAEQASSRSKTKTIEEYVSRSRRDKCGFVASDDSTMDLSSVHACILAGVELNHQHKKTVRREVASRLPSMFIY